MEKRMTKLGTFTALFLLAIMLFASNNAVFAQTFNGDKALTTQAEVDDFGANYTSISGKLTVNGFGISNVDALQNLTSIGGSLVIAYTGLTNVDGFSNLTDLGGHLALLGNWELLNIDGFSGLTEILGNTLNLTWNYALTNVDGLENITAIAGSLIIDGNTALENLDGLMGLTSASAASIKNNDALNNIDGLSNLTTLTGQLTLWDNPALTTIEGLSNLSSVLAINLRKCHSLNNLNGLGSLTSIRGLIIDNNASISTLDGMENLNYVDGNIFISANPALVDIEELSDVTFSKNLQVRDNPLLTNLDAFTGITAIEDISVYNNAALTDCCGIAHLIDEDDENGQATGSILIQNNPFSCESVNSILEQCTLPAGWETAPNGINCASENKASFDHQDQTFILETQGCHAPSYYSNSDSQGFIYTELCGDGELIAEIQSVDGNGWAGLALRESHDPGAKMIQLMIDGVYLTRRQLRISTGSMAYRHQFPTQGKNWLRLTRSGNSVGAYHSIDGSNWSPVLVSNLSLPYCIPVGLVTMNSTATGTLTAVFANVTLNDGTTLEAPSLPYLQEEQIQTKQLELFPNPNTGQFQINLSDFPGIPVQITVFNQLGQQVLQTTLQPQHASIQSLDLQASPSGTYWVSVIADGQEYYRKLIIR